jgi:hypothetical protein
MAKKTTKRTLSCPKTAKVGGKRRTVKRTKAGACQVTLKNGKKKSVPHKARKHAKKKK